MNELSPFRKLLAWKNLEIMSVEKDMLGNIAMHAEKGGKKYIIYINPDEIILYDENNKIMDKFELPVFCTTHHYTSSPIATTYQKSCGWDYSDHTLSVDYPYEIYYHTTAKNTDSTHKKVNV